ncbi:MAG: hypothetical protein D6762_09565 [Candidatus Neomarinimicrobiota bacterium]|nr:MAG: hypothetical protein D6762_09565 [Candidatus Neomarinimicrobiota bacterium]
MGTEDNFVPLTETRTSEPRKIPCARGKVLKKEAVQVREPLKIKPRTVHLDHPSAEMIEPIIEEGVVVGLYFTCVCGRTSEIRFELDRSGT